jgi:hypothetical protein
MAAYRNREVVKVLRHFLARAERGDVKGLAVCVRSYDNKEDIAVAGDYRTDVAHAVNVANRMSQRLTRLQDEMDAQG